MLLAPDFDIFMTRNRLESVFRPTYIEADGGVWIESMFNGSITLSPKGTGLVNVTNSMRFSAGGQIQFGEDITLDRWATISYRNHHVTYMLNDTTTQYAPVLPAEPWNRYKLEPLELPRNWWVD